MVIDSAFEKVYTNDVEPLKDIASIAQSLTTILAIFVSGFWGYWVFVKNRQQYPRVKLSHTITHHKIDDENILLHVIVNVQNSGDILLSLRTAATRVQQVIPLPEIMSEAIKLGLDPVRDGETEIDLWPLLGSHETVFQKNLFEAEPGEIQELHHDFIIPEDIKTIIVYSYLRNIKKRTREIGWNLTTYYDIQ